MNSTIDKKALVKKFLSETPKEFDYFIQHSMEFSSLVDSILSNDDEMSQRKLADKLGKEESEISKWLSGNHNLTLKSISKIEAALNMQLIFTRSEIINRFIPYIFRQMKSSYQHQQMDDLLTYYTLLEPLEDDSTFVYTENIQNNIAERNYINKPPDKYKIEDSISLEASTGFTFLNNLIPS